MFLFSRHFFFFFKEDTGFTPVYFWKSKGRDTLEAILVASLVTSLFSIGLYAREFVMVSIWRDKIAKPKVTIENFVLFFQSKWN
jgi:hypothetical protein